MTIDNTDVDNDELLQIGNMLAVLRERKKRQLDAKQASQRRIEIFSVVQDANSLSQELAEKVIRKVLVYHDAHIEIEYSVRDFFDAGIEDEHTECCWNRAF